MSESQVQSESRPAHWFKPGQSGNPSGKPKGTLNKLRADFVAALVEDFEESGAAAIVACREKDPASYLRVITALMPKELEIRRPLDELPDDELAAALVAARACVKAAEGPGGRAGDAVSSEQTEGVQPVQQAG